MWVRLLSARPSWRTAAPCSPVMQPPQDLPLDQRREHREVAGPVEQAQQPDHRVDELVGRVADGHARTASPPPGREVSGRRLQQQLGDGGRVQDQAEAERRPLGAGLGEVAGDRQVDRGDQVLPGAVLVHPVAQRDPFRALRDERQHRARHRRRRRVRCSTFEIRTPSMAVVMSGRAWRASRARSSSRSMPRLKHVTDPRRNERIRQETGEHRSNVSAGRAAYIGLIDIPGAHSCSTIEGVLHDRRTTASTPP